MFNSTGNIDTLKIMDMVGIEKEDQLFCFDLIQAARNEVLYERSIKNA